MSVQLINHQGRTPLLVATCNRNVDTLRYVPIVEVRTDASCKQFEVLGFSTSQESIALKQAQQCVLMFKDAGLMPWDMPDQFQIVNGERR